MTFPFFMSMNTTKRQSGKGHPGKGGQISRLCLFLDNIYLKRKEATTNALIKEILLISENATISKNT